MTVRRTLIWTAAVAEFAVAATAPLKPHDQLVDEVYAFLVSDVGIGGIRTMDGEPGGAPVPPYFYHFAIKHSDGLNSSTTGYPGYASISYPGYTAAVGIDAFLAYWAYSGDPQALARATEFADWLIPRRTPASDLYANWVYSTQTDGVMGGGFDGDAVMSDKPGMFALRCLRLYDITEQIDYLQAAVETADTYVATQLGGDPEDFGRWPFRVRPSDGLVRQDYTSHLIPAIQLLESLEARLPGHGYGQAAANAWSWLWANPLNPQSSNSMHWEGFYEDTPPATQIGHWEHYSAESSVAALVRRNTPGDLEAAIAILDWSTNRYLSPNTVQNGWGSYDVAILEWDLWPNTTYAATGQWAFANLLLDEATLGSLLHDSSWKPRAISALNTMTYGQGTEPLPADDRMLTTIRELSQPSFGTDTWYEQNFNTVIYVLACMGIATELAPADENHLLRQQGGELRSIAYGETAIECTFAAAGVARFKLVHEPAAVDLNGAIHLASSSENPGWSWDASTQLLEVRHGGGSAFIHLTAPTASPAVIATLRLHPPNPNPARAQTRFEFEHAHTAPVQLSIYDLAGRKVRELHPMDLERGFGYAIWDGRNAQGRRVAAGVYFAHLSAGTSVRTQRLVWLD